VTTEQASRKRDHLALPAITDRKGYWNHPSPIVWPPPLSYRQMRHIAAE
jgi:hypothetical protein